MSEPEHSHEAPRMQPDVALAYFESALEIAIAAGVDFRSLSAAFYEPDHNCYHIMTQTVNGRQQCCDCRSKTIPMDCGY